MTHNEAMQHIYESLKQGKYTYDDLEKLYVRLRLHEPDFDFTMNVSAEIDKLAHSFPHWRGWDGREWFGVDTDRRRKWDIIVL